ncbi:MAG: hypothetical protein IJ532_08920 [Alphaproteobacteria bacterium]|nr:hypothetical protein [Alphaproteobacteria bacterium]
MEYQVARQQREQQLIQNYNNQGITQDYPQYGTNFWGDNTDNNYGFGSSNIGGNIQNVTNQLNNSGFNNGQIVANSDYTINTESLVGKPSSYFQNNTYGSAMGRAIENTEGVVTTPDTTSYITQGTYTLSPVYNASKATGYQIQSPSDFASQQVNQSTNIAQNLTSSPIMEPIYRYLASVSPQYTIPPSPRQNMVHTNASSYPNIEKTTYDQFVQSDAYNQLRDFHILQEGYKRTIDDNGMVFPYPDINGDITGCIGHNMKNDFNTHPCISVKTGQSMNPSQISSEEKALLNMPRNLKPELYATKTDARLPQEYCENLYDQDIKNRWQTLNKAIPNWQQMSPEIQAATMDVHYTGNMEPENKWTIAKGAAQKMKQDDYCDNLHRDDTKRRDIIARNKWVRDMCLRGKFYK